MDYVVDIQGFKGSSNQVIPKEEAIVGIDFNRFEHWIVVPPCSFNDLPQKDIARTANTIFSRRREKKFLLQTSILISSALVRE